MLRGKRIAGLLWVFLLAGCAPSLQQLKMRDAEVRLPDKYGAPPMSQGDVAATTARMNWKEFFDDPTLIELIDTALNKNQELAILEQEINVEQNEILARQGEYLPKLSLGAEAGFEKVGKHTSQGVSDDAHGLPERLPNYLVGLTASWELDIWAKLRNATKAALYNYLATVDGRNFMVTRLIAEISQGYYELMALHKKVEILEQNIQIQQQALDVVRYQKQAARVTELAVKKFEAEVLKNQSRRYALRQQIIEKENELNFLAGRFPRPIQVGTRDFLKLVPKALDAGIPSKLMENRPDIRQAELELKAAKLDVDVAKARFYPSFSIEAGAGYRAFDSKYLFLTPESVLYNLAANLTVPLLNRNAIRADYYSAGSKQLEAVYQFEKTILKAYTDVANQLNKVENLKDTLALKSKEVATLEESVTISDTLFRAARCDYMEVLITRRDALEAQMELVEVKQQQLGAIVGLYQALGGGWTVPKDAESEH